MMTQPKSHTGGRFLHFTPQLLLLSLLVATAVLLTSGCSTKDSTNSQSQSQAQAPAKDSTATSVDTNFVNGIRQVEPQYRDVPGVRAWNQPKFAGWEWAQFENVKILYPPYHPLKAEIPNNAKAFKVTLRKTVSMLGMEPFTDTLVVIYYTGYGQGRAMTGHEYPYADSDAVHIWLPSFPGPPMLQWLLPKWSKLNPRYKFLYHGLIAMFDYSGQNYHQATHMFVDSNQFIPLRNLVVDTAINSNTERYQTGEAASFAAFLLSTRGLNGLRRVYESDLPFDSLMRLEYHTGVDTVQAMWLTFAKEFVPKDNTAKGGTGAQMKSDDTTKH